ncbi:MAG: GGDEF domain-containing protein [Phycisphaerales bacterium JB065]
MNYSSPAASSSPQNRPDFSGPLRVILVGHPPIERLLRRDPQIELVRAGTPLKAIGELGQPMDADSPRASIILLTPNTLPDTHTEAFINAARQIDASVAIVCSGGLDSEAAQITFDAVLAEDDNIEDLRQALAVPAEEPAAAAGQESALPSQAEATPKPSASARPRQTELPDDAKLVRAILSGRDIRSAALDQLRHRTGFSSLSVEPEPGDGACEAVVHRGHTLGYLCAPASSVPTSQLKVHALWLSHWLALAEQQKQLREAAFTDALTGAWNRRYFDRYLDSCLTRAAKLRQPVTVLLFDVDDFKRFNDSHGHALGDEILCATVRLLKTCIRPSDRVCRIGGDEFAVVFYEPDGPREVGSSQPTSIFDIARRFQQRVQTEEFSMLGPQSPGPLAISGGLATFPWDGRTPTELLEAADRLLIESKNTGKNAIRYGSGVICCDDTSCTKQGNPL